jgi:choline transport protein
MLAPKSCYTFLAYLTAWLTTLSWQAIAVSLGYLIATLLQGIVILGQPAGTYVPQAWHTVLIIWAVMLFAVFINSTTSCALARFEGLVLIVHLLGFFGVLIPLVYLGPHNDPAAVFTTFLNEGGWSTQALSFLVGLPSGAASLIGVDCAVHMSEEVSSQSSLDHSCEAIYCF